MKTKIKNWKKKTAVYIGRFQPMHDGHLEIVKKAIKKIAKRENFCKYPPATSSVPKKPEGVLPIKGYPSKSFPVTT